MLDRNRFGWVNEERYGGITIAVAEGLTEDDLIKIYGGDPATSAPSTFDESAGYVHGDDVFFVQTVVVGDHVVAIENNGGTGSVAEIARRVSAGDRRFLSAYLNTAIGHFVVICAVGGVVEGWHNDRSAVAKTPDAIEEWAEALSSETGWPMAGALALIMSVTGVEVSERWFDLPQRTTPIPDVDTLLPQAVLGRDVSGGDIIQSDPAAWAP